MGGEEKEPGEGKEPGALFIKGPRGGAGKGREWAVFKHPSSLRIAPARPWEHRRVDGWETVLPYRVSPPFCLKSFVCDPQSKSARVCVRVRALPGAWFGAARLDLLADEVLRQIHRPVDDVVAQVDDEDGRQLVLWRGVAHAGPVRVLDELGGAVLADLVAAQLELVQKGGGAAPEDRREGVEQGEWGGGVRP